MNMKGSTFDHLVEMVEQLHLDICEIKTSITGGLDGKPGINDRIRIVEDCVSDLQGWRIDHNRRLNNFLWKVAGSAVIGGGTFAAIIKFLPMVIK